MCDANGRCTEKDGQPCQTGSDCESGHVLNPERLLSRGGAVCKATRHVMRGGERLREQLLHRRSLLRKRLRSAVRAMCGVDGQMHGQDRRTRWIRSPIVPWERERHLRGSLLRLPRLHLPGDYYALRGDAVRERDAPSLRLRRRRFVRGGFVLALPWQLRLPTDGKRMLDDVHDKRGLRARIGV